MKKNIQNKTGYCMLWFCLAFTCVSCKKNTVALSPNGSESFYIRFKANGIQKNYLIPMTQSKSHDSLTLAGNKTYWFEVAATNSNMESLDIGVYSNRYVVANTYKETDLLFGYQPKAMIAMQIPGGLGYISCAVYDPQIFPQYNKACMVTISSLTNKDVKGTFSATLYQMDNTMGYPSLKDSIQITGGEFYMPVK